MFYNTLNSKSGSPWDIKRAGYFQSPSAHRDTQRHVPGTAFLRCEGQFTGMLGGPLFLTPVFDEKLILSNVCVLAPSYASPILQVLFFFLNGVCGCMCVLMGEHIHVCACKG